VLKAATELAMAASICDARKRKAITSRIGGDTGIDVVGGRSAL
jgi:hypothetical protein